MTGAAGRRRRRGCGRRRYRRWPRRARGTAVWLAVLVCVAVSFPLERDARAAPQPIGVIAPAGSRLAGELKRELAGASLASVSMVTSDRDWPVEMIDLVSIPYLQGVVVGSNEGRMIVFSRAATSGRVEVRFELRFDPNDRPARRRACLAVVEGLRALSDMPPSSVGPANDNASSAVVVRGGPATLVDRAAISPAPPQEVVAGAPVVFIAPREPWVMGVATMLDVDRGLGTPTGHLEFMWFIPVGARFAFRLQTLWPLVGSALRAGAGDVRIWTFGAAVGMDYVFAPAQARWRPFAGLAIGSQLLLTDTAGAAEVDKSRALFVPSANLRLQTGVRFAIATRLQLLGELEATRDWLLQSRLSDYRDSAANALAFHMSLGVLFEY
jgi:hypothetical protein